MNGWLISALAGTIAAVPAVGQVAVCSMVFEMLANTTSNEVQLTRQPYGHILTNVNVWSPDGKRIVYDTRSDSAGAMFDGRTIEVVHVETGEVQTIYESKNGACCGVATFHPIEDRVIFIHGPENPTAQWQYGPCHRHGAVVDLRRPGQAQTLDARDLTPPFTPGALRGGSHVHIYSPAGDWVSFTYEDHVLAALDESGGATHDPNQRNIGVSVPIGKLTVPKTSSRNHDGEYFTVLATVTTGNPRPGSDEISRACEEGWIGARGYRRADGAWQRWALAFQGEVTTASGSRINEVFLVDLPEDVTQPGDGPLEGTATTRPRPPRGTLQRRLTYTADRTYPGIQGPRHWLRCSPDGSRIAFLMRDASGVVQIWTVSPLGGEPQQLTRDKWDIGSAFTWSPDGGSLTYVADGSVFVADARTGRSRRLTEKRDASLAPRPEACVFSPNGRSIAYVRPVPFDDMAHNQVFVVSTEQ